MKTRLFSIFLFMALIASMFGAGQPARAVSASNAFPADTERAQAQALDPASLLNPDGTLDLTSNPHGVFDLRGWDVTLDALRGPILTPSATSPDALAWASFAKKGLNDVVRALAVIGSDLYVGGDFTQTADGTMTLNYIAKYSNGAWSALANNGLNDWVSALAVSGSDLYVGGAFIETADSAMTLNYIAKYSGGVWSPLANQGLNGSVDALAVSGSDMYVGGGFTQTNDGVVTNLNRIAKYSGGAWSPFANQGLNSYVETLAVNGSDLYVGGWFTKTGDGAITLKYIAKYSNGMWLDLPNGGLNNVVWALAASGNDLYVGGWFTKTADLTMTLNHVAKYSHGSWSPLANNGLNSYVYAFAMIGSDMYVGGAFTKTADGAMTNLNSIAKYSDGGWSALANNGLNEYILTLAASGGDLYAGGNFTETVDGNVTNLNRIAKLTATPASVATFRSAGAQDGWVLESSETSNKGGTLNSAAATFRLGDDAAKKQYRAILSFKTASLPDNAVITKITLKVKRQGVTGGGDPVNAFQGFMADVKKGTFGTSALQAADFQAVANKTVGPVKPTPNGGWYSINLTGAKAFINKLASNGGLTQIRLRFKLDDNNNAAANYLSLFSGNAPLASRPQLIVEYYVP
ncbi:MAG: DNRLRE domain-containing protein [Anaerolineales bacterium]|nr:MAG: DNRLRE domain-containing protein [Anaerolineales bacterium]